MALEDEMEGIAAGAEGMGDMGGAMPMGGDENFEPEGQIYRGGFDRQSLKGLQIQW